ncbi:MAG: hypothetical protein DYG93_01665 [Leptolyngbya sp. PLA2]|nr:hypothetical protein [Leptolyngbya sp. PL-A2]MCQ3941076.1 hypothetical protein [cyanobacterium CYA1]MCZ7633060.1 ATP-dependent Clp protease proteolytic subunit [Phycisphaerales bacterium]MDL1905669.1 hypothetical protein [Synechococcales cyanobacterium CNB]
MKRADRLGWPGSRTLDSVRRLVGIVCVGVLLASSFAGWSQPGQSATVPAGRQADNVAIITIEGDINSVTAFSFTRRLRLAEQGGADAIVVELNTPGGEVGAVLEICDAIRSSNVPNIVAWIHPNAYSGGAIIALACRQILVSDPATMGDALPVAASFGFLNALPEAERQKVLAPLIAEVVNLARLRGWDEFLVQAIVSRHVELWWVRDRQTGERMAINEAEYRRLFEGEPMRDRPRLVSASAGGAPPPPEAAPSPAVPPSEGYVPASPYLQELAADISGGVFERATRPVITNADRGRFELLDYICTGEGPIVLKERDLAYFGLAANVDQTTGALTAFNSDEDVRAWFGAKNIRRLDASWSEAMVKFLTNMIVRGVLIVVFVLALFIAMTHPGLLVPEGVAMLALVALLAPPFLIGMANWWEIAAILVGIGLIILEIFVFPGFGVPGVLGLLLLFGGLLGTFVEDTPGGLFPDSPKAQSDMLYAVLTIVLAVTTSGIGVYFLSKHFGSLPIVSGLVLRDTIGKPADDTDDEFLAALGDPDDVGVALGDEATTVTPLRPAGRVEINGRLVDVVAEMGYIPEGRRVRVVSVGKFRVGVEEVTDGPVTGQEGGRA